MATPFPLQTQFIGMVQDSPRDLLPAGALWNSVDYIPEYLGSPLRKRGGWAYASLALGTSTYIQGVGYANFAGTEKNIAVGQDGNIYSFTSGGSSSLGAAPTGGNSVPPIVHRTGSPTVTTMIFTSDGAVAPKSYDGTTFQALAGTPPLATFSAVWNDRALLGSGSDGTNVNNNRVWFGPVGNSAGTWDKTNAWVDSNAPLTGIGVLKTAIMMFHLKSTERLRGTIPPGTNLVTDFVQDQAFQVGCIDARTIANYNDTLLWADTRGVYQTDGAALKDLTATAGMRSYWRTLLSSYSSTYRISAGVINDTYVISLMNGTSFVDCLAYDLTRGFWFRLSNFPGRCFARTGSTFEECFMGLGNAGRVASLSSIFTPTAALKNDGDGTAVAPLFETALFRGFMRLHRRWIPSLSLQDWKDLYFNYILTDAASDAPTLTIGYLTDPSSTSYTSISRVLAATTKYTRSRRILGFNANGLALKVSQTGPSADTRISGFESDYEPREGSRLAQ